MGAFYSNQINMNAAVVAAGVTNSACPVDKLHQPMGECGLPTITVSVTKNGAPVQVMSYGGRPVAGNTFTITLTDDMGYYGNNMVLNIPCSYTTAGQGPADGAAGIAFSYSVSAENSAVMVQTKDNQMVPATFVIDPTSN
ncbi:hypothetical protein HK101_003136 [Irineochytrium annulatum]|nr:hypothetical protein HK101_003136 [Irineochytrium annulatum]